MNAADRRRRIEDLCHAALEQDPRARASFVATACGSDEALRGEVEALLAHAQAAEGFLATPLEELAARALTDERGASLLGRSFGPYHIRAQLGSGGMGDVYRAHDPRLRREVALKILPAAFTNDPDRLARFQREAEILASLNHPHIGAIYGLEESDNVRALVLELIEGPTLAERIANGPLPLDEALSIATHIAEALDAAHERGVIHRDLKPANIKLTASGGVKVLDFGLAKVGGTTSETAALSNSPTMFGTSVPGMVLGTAAYMSPEQAKGHEADHTSDLWAFGCVLYEMLSGRPVFEGTTTAEILSEVLKSEPDWKGLPPSTPEGIRRLLRRCLEKDRTERLRHVGDARIEIRDAVVQTLGLVEGLRGADPQPSPQSRFSSRAAAAWFVAGLCVATAAAWMLIRAQQPPPTPGPIRLPILLPGISLSETSAFAVSPDGRHLAFTGSGGDGVVRLWVRSMDALEAQPLSGTELALGGLIPQMFWSPDSRFIAFDAFGQLKKVDVTGGTPQTVCDLPALAVGGTWSRDDVIIVGNPAGGLMRCPASAGLASVVTTPDSSRGEGAMDIFPSFLPDGRHFLYLRVSRSVPESSGVYIGSLDARPDEPTSNRILATGFGAAFVPDREPHLGQILFLRDETLFAQPFDARRLQLSGAAVRVAEPVGSHWDQPFFTASTNGVLVFRAPDEDVRLTWFDRRGTILGRASEPGHYSGLALAPDGARAVVVKQAARSTIDQDLWLVELSQSRMSPLTFDSRLERSPVWSANGRRIIFTSSGETGALFEQSLSGTDAAQLLLRTEEHNEPTSASHDGQFLLYTAETLGSTRRDLWVLPLSGERKPFAFFRREFDQEQGQFSPDGRWVAYVSNESGRHQVLVRPFSSNTPAGAEGAVESLPVSKAGGTAPRWRGDGRELFYFALDGTVTAVDVTTGNGFETGPPKLLFHAAGARADWAVTKNGERFLLATPGGHSTSPFTVVFNWQPISR